MSLWTPDGERPIGDNAPELSPEQEEQARQMAHDLSEARQQLLEAEVATVVANHALGIYELAALHLTVEDPDLVEARLAIDALGALVEGLEGRLGDGEPTLTEAVANIRLAYVQRVHQAKNESTDGGSANADPDSPA